MLSILAQGIAGWSISNLAIAIIVVAGIVAVVFVILKQLGIAIPPFIVTLFWILVAVVVGVVCVKFLASL